MSDPRNDMDTISDILKTNTLRAYRESVSLPEVEIPAVFVNRPDGPQFFPLGRGTTGQPLYLTPARDGQEPVAWITRQHGRLITQDKRPYRDDIVWEPLYLAR